MPRVCKKIDVVPDLTLYAEADPFNAAIYSMDESQISLGKTVKVTGLENAFTVADSLLPGNYRISLGGGVGELRTRSGSDISVSAIQAQNIRDRGFMYMKIVEETPPSWSGSSYIVEIIDSVSVPVLRKTASGNVPVRRKY